MYHLIKKILIIGVVSWVIGGCSSLQQGSNLIDVTKRKYRPGYHVESSLIHNPNIKSKSNRQTNIALSSALTLPDLISPAPALNNEIEQPSPRNRKTDTVSCALMILQNGKELLVKVQQIKNKVVTYKNCKKLSGEIEQRKKTQIVLIRYPDGDKKIFNTSPPPSTDTLKADTVSSDTVSSTDTVKDTVKEKKSASSSSDDNKTKTSSSDIDTRWDWLSLSSFALAMIALLSLFVYVAIGVGVLLLFWIIGGLLALIMGIVGLIRTSTNDALKGKGFAIVGMLVGLAEVILFLLILFLLILVLASI